MRRTTVSVCMAAALVLGAGDAARQAPATRREAGAFDYARRSDRIGITLPCPDLALCVAPPHLVGRITDDGLVFDRALNYRTPLRYQRVSR